jgi:hypothetical protein
LLGLVVSIAISFSKLDTLTLIIRIGIPLSLLTALYAWSHDHVLLLPALIIMAMKSYEKSVNWTITWLVLFNIGCWFILWYSPYLNEFRLLVVPIAFLMYGFFYWIWQGSKPRIRLPLDAC